MFKSIYIRLALTNLKKNKRSYVPFLLTSIITIMMFFDMYMIMDNSGVREMPGADSMRSILGFGMVIVAIFAFIFLFYTNSFLIKQRRKEIGLYNVLGMGKKELSIMMFWESLTTGGISIVIGLIFGIFNGYLVAYWSVPSFITSMASMNISKGVASVFTKTQSVSWPQSSDPVNGWFRNIASYNGFPVGLVIFLGMAVVCGIVLYNTKPGRYILCLGSNSEAVRLSGVNTRKWRMLAYVICGFLVGIGALFFVATYTTVQPGYGDQYNNEAIAGCVMGGTSMVGGLASIGGTVIGVFIISLLQQGIMAFGLGKGQQMIITGIIVIVAVYADVSARRRKN